MVTRRTPSTLRCRFELACKGKGGGPGEERRNDGSRISFSEQKAESVEDGKESCVVEESELCCVTSLKQMLFLQDI